MEKDLNEILLSFLDLETNKEWLYIVEGDFIALDKHIEELDDAEKQAKLKLISKLLKDKTLDALSAISFEAEDNSPIYQILVKLFFSLIVGEREAELIVALEEFLLQQADTLVQRIYKDANGYPNNTITALTWMNGAAMRTTFAWLAYYYELMEDVDRQLSYTIGKTKMTLAVMSHYKEHVGPDMLGMARLFEKVGNAEAALASYNGIKADFDEELEFHIEEFDDDVDPSITSEDVIILNVLKEALSSIDRLDGTQYYTERIQLIDRVLMRPVVDDVLEDDE